MKPYFHILITSCAMICFVYGSNETTQWTNHFIVDQGPSILTQVPDLKASENGKYLITITRPNPDKPLDPQKPEGFAEVKVSVKMMKEPKIKKEWKIIKTTYAVTGSGALFGTDGLPTTGEHESPAFILIFDYRPQFLGTTKETTLFSQVKLYGQEEGTGKTITDSGVSGKDTDPTISATYTKG